MATASADPEKLDRAAAAVPPEVKDVLVQAVVRGDLANGIARFASMRQNPQRLALRAEGLVGAVTSAKTTGDELDTRLVRIAAEFRRAGGHRAGVPRGWQGPVAPGSPAGGSGKPPTTIYMDDAALQARMGRWGRNQGLEWRQRVDGNVEMRGPDGNWYLVVGSPPPGAPVLGRSQRTVDFTNMKAGAIKSAAVTTGLAGTRRIPRNMRRVRRTTRCRWTRTVCLRSLPTRAATRHRSRNLSVVSPNPAT